MPTPDFILALRAKVGHDLLWLMGALGVVIREGSVGDEVLLVQRADTGVWTPIGGIVEVGEAPWVTIEREILEETGVIAQVERLVAVMVVPPITYLNGDQCQFLDHCFRCRWVSGKAHVADDESRAVAWFPVDQLPHMKPTHVKAIELALSADAPVALLDYPTEG